MQADRYLKIILTVIALELFWIGIKDVAPPVAAQVATTPVIIRGIEIGNGDTGVLPVALVEARKPVPIEALRPIRIEAERPLTVQADRPIPIEALTPLLVQPVPYTPAPRPGE